MIDNVQFEFFGINPSDELQHFISAVAERLSFNAPSDSAVKISLGNGKDKVRAYCRIVSQVGTFIAETSGGNPFRALLQIERKIKHQLDQWKQRRFSDYQMPPMKANTDTVETPYGNF